MAWQKAQLSLGEDTSSPILELLPSQRVQGKYFPFEHPAGQWLPQKEHRGMPPGRDSHFAAHTAPLQGEGHAQDGWAAQSSGHRGGPRAVGWQVWVSRPRE